MAGLTGQWQEQLSEEFHKEYYQKLFLFVKEQYSKVPVYPPAEELFNAFHLTPFRKGKSGNFRTRSLSQYRTGTRTQFFCKTGGGDSAVTC